MYLASLVDKLTGQEKLSVPQIETALGEFEVDDAWCNEKLAGDYPQDSYSRVLLHTDAHFEVVLAIWPDGVATPPHNHGVFDSHGAALVLKGMVFNQTFEQLPDGCLNPSERSVHSAGELIRVSKGLIHQMGSDEGLAPSLSLHVYSPAIVEPRYWDAETRKPLGSVEPETTQSVNL